VLDIAAVFGTLTGGGPFRLVDAAAGALVILRFAIAGLVMGGAYPLIRGATGLGKGLNLFVTLAGPALCVTLLPAPRADDALAGALLQLAQWLSFGLVIGLAADWLLTLRRHGYGLRHLRELHRMNALTASASTLLVAVLTATATAVGTGASGRLRRPRADPGPHRGTPDPEDHTRRQLRIPSCRRCRVQRLSMVHRLTVPQAAIVAGPALLVQLPPSLGSWLSPSRMSGTHNRGQLDDLKTNLPATSAMQYGRHG